MTDQAKAPRVQLGLRPEVAERANHLAAMYAAAERKPVTRAEAIRRAVEVAIKQMEERK